MIHEKLRVEVRKDIGKEESPSVGIIDSQSARMTSVAGEEKGYDGGKKVKGRKRHIIVGTLGLLIEVVVHRANKHDSKAAKEVFEQLNENRFDFSRLEKFYADGGYRGELGDWLKKQFNWNLEVVKRTELHKFKVLPKRWIVERTFAWLNNYRRLIADYERLTESSLAFIKLSMVNFMIIRIFK